MTREIDDPENVNRFLSAISQRCARTSTESAMLSENSAPTTQSSTNTTHPTNTTPERSSTESVSPEYGNGQHLSASSPVLHPAPSPHISGIQAPNNTPLSAPHSTALAALRVDPFAERPLHARTQDKIALDAVVSFAETIRELSISKGSTLSPDNVASVKAPERSGNLTPVPSVNRSRAVDESFGRMSFKVADTGNEGEYTSSVTPSTEVNAPKLAGHTSSNMRSTAMPRKEEARLGFADLPRWMQEHHLAKQGKTVKQGTPKEEVAVKKQIAVKHENVVEKENKVETAPVAEKDGPANMHLSAEARGENAVKKEASPVTKSALPPHLRPATLSASGPAKQSITTEAKEPEKLNLTTQAGEPEKKSLTIEADAPAPLSQRSSNAAISTSETNKVTLPADFMARWLSNKKAAATSTPEQSSTLIHDPAPAQELEDAQRSDSKPDAPPASALGSPATKPVESSTLTSNDTPSTAKPSTNTAEVEEDRTNAQTFSSWGTVEVRDRPAAKIRTVQLRTLPPNSTPAFIASLVYGGAVERIQTIGESSASVRFLDADACDKFYHDTANGLVYAKDALGKEKVVWVTKTKDVDVVGGLLRQWIEAEYTRCVRAVPVDEDIGQDYLRKMASRKNRGVEGIEVGRNPGGSRYVIFRFTDIAHSVQFRAALLREEEFEDCNITFVADPCAAATVPRISI